MAVNKSTKIGELLKMGDEMTELITSIHPKFTKLSNPFLRKAIAPRVTVQDAARIAGIPVNDFLKKLEEKGIEVEYETTDTEEEYVTQCDLTEKYKPVRLNAIELLEKNIDPFDPVMKKLKELAPGEALEVVVDFIPSPLIDILKRQGYESCVLKKDGIYYTYFYKPYKKRGFWEKIKTIFGKTHSDREEKHSGPAHEEDFEKIKQQFEGRMKIIDVRDLEMPQPMMKILETLDTLKPGEALFVEHKRIPQFLLPELEKKNYLWTTKKLSDDHTRMLIYKKHEE